MSIRTVQDLAGVCHGLRVLARHTYEANPQLLLVFEHEINRHLERGAAGQDPALTFKELVTQLQEDFPQVVLTVTEFVNGVTPGEN